MPKQYLKFFYQCIQKKHTALSADRNYMIYFNKPPNIAPWLIRSYSGVKLICNQSATILTQKNGERKPSKCDQPRL